MNQQDYWSWQLYLIAVEKTRHNSEVEKEKDGFSTNNPPINERSLLNNQVEHALVDQSIECRLLHNCTNADITHAEEDRVHDNEGLREWVTHGEQGHVHELGAEHTLFLNDIDSGINVVLRCKLNSKKAIGDSNQEQDGASILDVILSEQDVLGIHSLHRC